MTYTTYISVILTHSTVSDVTEI